MMARIAIVVIVAMWGVHGAGETLRLPALYVQTKYTVHLLTGLESDHRSREIKTPAPMEVTKWRRGDTTGLQFVNQTQGKDDVSQQSSASITMGQRDELVAALRTAEDKGRHASLRREELQEVLWSDEESEMAAVFVAYNGGRNWRVEWVVGRRTYVLGRNHIRQVIRALRKFR